ERTLLGLGLPVLGRYGAFVKARDLLLQVGIPERVVRGRSIEAPDERNEYLALFLGLDDQLVRVQENRDERRPVGAAHLLRFAESLVDQRRLADTSVACEQDRALRASHQLIRESFDLGLASDKVPGLDARSDRRRGARRIPVRLEVYWRHLERMRRLSTPRKYQSKINPTMLGGTATSVRGRSPCTTSSHQTFQAGTS